MQLTEDLAKNIYANAIEKKYKELGETPKYILSKIENAIQFYELRGQMEEAETLQICLDKAINELLPTTIDEAYDILETYCLAARQGFYANVESNFIKHHLEELMDSVLVFERNEQLRNSVEKSHIYKEYTSDTTNYKKPNEFVTTTTNPKYKAILDYLKKNGFMGESNNEQPYIFAVVFDAGNDIATKAEDAPNSFYNIKKSFLDFFVETTINKRNLKLYD